MTVIDESLSKTSDGSVEAILPLRALSESMKTNQLPHERKDIFCFIACRPCKVHRTEETCSDDSDSLLSHRI